MQYAPSCPSVQPALSRSVAALYDDHTLFYFSLQFTVSNPLLQTQNFIQLRLTHVTFVEIFSDARFPLLTNAQPQRHGAAPSSRGRLAGNPRLGLVCVPKASYILSTTQQAKWEMWTESQIGARKPERAH